MTKIEINRTSSGNIAYSNAVHEGSLTKGNDQNGLIQDWMAKSTLPRPCITNHEASAITFFLRIIEWVRANY